MATTFLPSTLLYSVLHGLVVILLIDVVHASSASPIPEPPDFKMPLLPDILRWLRSMSSPVRQHCARILGGRAGAWNMMQLIAFCGLIGAVGSWRSRRKLQHGTLVPDSSGTCNSQSAQLDAAQEFCSQVAYEPTANYPCRYRKDGPGPSEKVYYLQVLHHILWDLYVVLPQRFLPPSG